MPEKCYCEEQYNITRLTLLTHLNIAGHNFISDLSPLIKLQYLVFGGYKSCISDNGIMKLTNLTQLNIGDNPLISTLSYFPKLINFRAEYCLSTPLFDISKFYKLRTLTLLDYPSGHIPISYILSLTNLTELNIDWKFAYQNWKLICSLPSLIYLNGKSNFKF